MSAEPAPLRRPLERILRAGPARPRRSRDELVLEVIHQHAPGLLRLARRHSLCADDAQDAYQRALEIFLRHADRLEEEGMVSWLRTVVKHEAMAVRESRQRQVATDDADLDRRESPRAPSTDEAIDRFDLLTRAAEALQQLKAQEVRALLLKAEGHSYAEICRITGWSYTKVNRCLTEGRRSFLERCADIESGRECERWAPVISAMVDGEAKPRQLVRLRAHLRHCPACRATVREFARASGRAAAVVPLAGAAGFTDPARDAGSHLLVRVYEALAGGVHERAIASAQKLQAAAEIATTGKVAAVAASAAALAGGGAAVVGGAIDRPLKPPPPVTQQAAADDPGGAGSDEGSKHPVEAPVTTVPASSPPVATTTDAQPPPQPPPPEQGDFGVEQAAVSAQPSQTNAGSTAAAAGDFGAGSGGGGSGSSGSSRRAVPAAGGGGGGGGEFGP
jgi:RNA polymerase sigma factor (sigma-70 family)